MSEKPSSIDVTENSDNSELKSEFGGILNTLTTFKSQITLLQSQMRSLEKNVNKKIKVFVKEAKKNKNKGNRKPSGFAVPTKITDELCEFMKKPPGTKIARTEVTQYIIEYIRDNKLQQADNRRYISPDNRLTKLLDVTGKDKITYFNIQKYMNKHFVKDE